MRIAIASGKGGAGKTSVAASLGHCWPRTHILADADVEAPNLHLFLQPTFEQNTKVALTIPAQVTESCTSCGQCRDICHFGAIAKFGKKIMLFPDMCHACGGCFAVCTPCALTEGEREIGTLHLGYSNDGAPWISGTTRVGEVMTPPLLRSLFARLSDLEQTHSGDVIIDSPPGVSCPAVTVASHVDALVMVVDSSPFGIHDFRLAHEAFSKLNIPLACVLNRANLPGNSQGDEQVRSYCKAHNLPLLAELPFERDAAVAYSAGTLLADISPTWQQRFQDLAQAILHTFGGQVCAK